MAFALPDESARATGGGGNISDAGRGHGRHDAALNSW
jgi:hypothetical protein